MKTIKKVDETISAFDAKIHLSKLLQEVEQGHVITITKRGKPVARLVPYSDSSNSMDKKELLNQFKKIRKKVKDSVNIKSYISEGRKY